MKRDYKNIDKYLDELYQDIYSQQEDDGHRGMIKDIVEKWIRGLDFQSVVDVGCGSTQVFGSFLPDNIVYFPVSLGDDAKYAIENDMSFLDFDDNSVDLVWCRHTLEHSPMPLLTLMEFHRIAKKYLCLVMPNPKHYTFVGRNHYCVAEPHQIGWLLRRAGWKVEKFEGDATEFRFLCTKQPRLGYEGYASAPIDHKIYAAERDCFGTRGIVVDVNEAMNPKEKESPNEQG